MDWTLIQETDGGHGGNRKATPSLCFYGAVSAHLLLTEQTIAYQAADRSTPTFLHHETDQ